MTSMRRAGVTFTVRRPLKERVLSYLVSDSVRNFIWFYYACFIAGSIHLAFFTYPIRVIIGPMGQGLYNAWVWMPLIAAPAALGGLWLRHGGSPAMEINSQLLRRDFLGLWMQVGGHALMAIVLAVFIVTAWVGREPGQPIPSAFWLLAYLIGVAVLCFQCCYKLWRGRRRRR
jgi:hypothetical protein